MTESTGEHAKISIDGELKSGQVTNLAQQALAGDASALGHLLDRFTPWLSALARARMSATLRAVVDPVDVVHDVWVVALRTIHDVPPVDGHYKSPILRHLTTILHHRIGSLAQKYAGPRAPRQLAGADDEDLLRDVPAQLSSAITVCARAEIQGRLHQALELLPPEDREIILARGIEQCAYDVIAERTGIPASTLRMRYTRALRRLKQLLRIDPATDLPDD